MTAFLMVYPTEHASTADTTSGMAVLPIKAKLLVGEILEVIFVTLSLKVSVKRTINTFMITKLINLLTNYTLDLVLLFIQLVWCYLAKTVHIGY